MCAKCEGGVEFAWLPRWTPTGWVWLKNVGYKQCCGVKAYWRINNET